MAALPSSVINIIIIIIIIITILTDICYLLIFKATGDSWEQTLDSLAFPMIHS
jgi:hypothetical protein